MSDNLLTLPTYNIFAESQTSTGDSNPLLVGEFTFDTSFLEQLDLFINSNFNPAVPIVTLSSDMTQINEGENLALNFDLSSPVPAGGLTVELDLIEGNDSIAQGFEFLPEASSNITDLKFLTDDAGEFTGAEVTIAEGATSASIVSEIVADNLTEGDESVSLGLVNLDAYDVDGGEVNFTIIDTSTGDSASGVPVVTLSSDVTEINEGENLALNFDLSSPVPAGGLTVELDLIEGNDSIAQGFEFLPEASSNITDLKFLTDDAGEFTGAEVTIAEGATSASIVSEIVADNLTEGDESVSLGLVNLDAYDVDGGEVNFTIIDTSTGDSASGVPVVTLSSDVTEINEGENLALNFDLSSPVPAGGLTVELDLIEGNDSIAQGFEFLPEASSNITDLKFLTDDAGEFTGAEVTIAEGATSASIVSEIVADNLTEGDESVSLGLVDLDTYDVGINFSIIDTSTDLNTSVVEVEGVPVPFLGDVDFAVTIDYDLGIDASSFVSEPAIFDSIETYLANELQNFNFSELMVDDLAEFLASDSGLGIGSISESLTLDVEIAPNNLIPEPILVSSTVFA